MIEVNSRRHPSAALLYRRLLTGNDPARPRAARDRCPVVRSPLRDAGSACRDWPKRFVTPSLPKQAFNATRQQTASTEIPIASDARSLHTSRGFLPWRFAYAGRGARRATFMGPASANLHISRHRAHGGAELRWNADTFAEMHRSIAVAACEE